MQAFIARRSAFPPDHLLADRGCTGGNFFYALEGEPNDHETSQRCDRGALSADVWRGGGGGTVDPTTIFQTGQIIPMYGTGVLTGFVRANGRTIGSATSGATERANADAQSLFQNLWGADANLAVSGGRGASAAADWAA